MNPDIAMMRNDRERLKKRESDVNVLADSEMIMLRQRLYPREKVEDYNLDEIDTIYHSWRDHIRELLKLAKEIRRLNQALGDE